MSYDGCGRPGCHSSAGQNRLRVGGQHLVGQHDGAVAAAAELELGVGQDDAALPGDRLGAGVDVEGEVAQRPRVGLADGVDDGGEVDVLVVLAELGLGRGREDRLGQPAAVLEPRRQRDAADAAGGARTRAGRCR